MDAIEKKRKKVRKEIKKNRRERYRTLRNLRKARDIASKHLEGEVYTTNYVFKHIKGYSLRDDWGNLGIDELAIYVYTRLGGKFHKNN